MNAPSPKAPLTILYCQQRLADAREERKQLIGEIKALNAAKAKTPDQPKADRRRLAYIKLRALKLKEETEEFRTALAALREKAGAVKTPA